MSLLPQATRSRRRRRTGIAVLVAALGLLTACSSSSGSTTSSDGASSSGQKVTISMPAPLAIYAPLFYGQAKGLFEKEGIDANVQVVSSQQSVTALAGGSIQFTVSAAPGNDIAAFKAPIKLVGTFSQKADAQLVVQPGITSVADLKGKSIAISAPGSFSDFMARSALASAGLSASDVTLRPLGDLSTTVAAFTSGQVDAAVMSEPTVSQLLKAVQGSSSVYDFTRQTAWNQAGIYVNTDWASSHKDETVAVLRAIDASLKAWRNDPEGAKATLTSAVKSGDPDADYKHTLQIDSAGVMAVSQDTERTVLAALQSSGQADANPDDWSKWVDNSYVSELNRQ